MFRAFFAANRRLCIRIEHYLPYQTTNLTDLYVKVVAQYMNSRAGGVVVDVGGGRRCLFARYRDPAAQAKIIAVDISEEKLSHNADVDEKRVADISQGLPFEAEEIDLLTSCWVLEHLVNVDSFVKSAKVAMKRGGYSIHLFASKFAPYALINQALPEAFADKVVYGVLPRHKEGRHGGRFPDFYDRCYYSAIKKVMENHGFEVVGAHLRYYQSRYFSFFVPLYVLSVLYEMLIQALAMKNLAARVLIVARKK